MPPVHCPQPGDHIVAREPSGTRITIAVEYATFTSDNTLHVHEQGSHDIYEFPDHPTRGQRHLIAVRRSHMNPLPPIDRNGKCPRCEQRKLLQFPPVSRTSTPPSGNTADPLQFPPIGNEDTHGPLA